MLKIKVKRRDVLREILHVYPAHVKKALAMTLLSGKF